jgi:hypothetical protein
MARKSAKKIKITKSQLLYMCGSAFDRGYYKGLYQEDRKDESIDIFNNWWKGRLKEILKEQKIKL